MRTTYPTDIFDAEWSYLEPHLPAPRATGRPRVYPLRESLNAIFYVARSGRSWRFLLPHDFPPWRSVYHYYFGQFRLDGTWERMHAALRERVGVRLERDPQPSAGIVDSQSLKSTGVGGNERGYDGAKRVKGSLSAIRSSTRKDWCSRPRSTARRSWTTRGDRNAVGSRKGAVRAPLSSADGRRLQRGESKGGDWVRKMFGWGAEIVSRPRKPAPEEVLMA